MTYQNDSSANYDLKKQIEKKGARLQAFIAIHRFWYSSL